MGCSERVKILGVINLSPESFYPGSVAKSADEALYLARSALEEGADIIDIGGMSSAPYRDTSIPVEVEVERVLKAVKLIKKETNAVLSVDTFRSKVAEAALSAGADIINDVSGLQADKKMVKIIADHSASVILMAKEDYAVFKKRNKILSRPIDIIISTLRKCVETAQEAGIASDQIVLDPGIGFFRKQKLPWYEWDMQVLTSLSGLTILGYPIAVGVSRKSFIGEITGIKDPGQRLYGSIAAETIAVMHGADIVRTHDAASSIQAIKISEEARKLCISSRKDRCYPSAKEGSSEVYQIPFINTPDDSNELFEVAGVESRGYAILAGKSAHRNILLLNVPVPLLLIIKQEMLSLGGDVATPMDAILGKRENGNGVIMGSISQILRLCSRLEKMKIDFLEKRGMLTPKRLSELVKRVAL